VDPGSVVQYKIRVGSEFSFTMRKKVETNYEFLEKADIYHKHHKIQNNNIIFLLITGLACLYNTFFPNFFGCMFFARSSLNPEK
jgi:thiosulfate reductase cytochrome b subunit